MAIWHAISTKILIRIVAMHGEKMKLTDLRDRYHTPPPPVQDGDTHTLFVYTPSHKHTWVSVVYSALSSPLQLLGGFEPRPELCLCMPVSLCLCPPPSRHRRKANYQGSLVSSVAIALSLLLPSLPSLSVTVKRCQNIRSVQILLLSC